MFFFRNKHIMCDFGTGDNNKLKWVLEDKQELIDIIETIYRGAKKGRGLVVSPKGTFHLPTLFPFVVQVLISVLRLLDPPPLLDDAQAISMRYCSFSFKRNKLGIQKGVNGG